MPGTLVTALTAPLNELAALVGQGWSANHPSSQLAEIRDRLTALAEMTTRAWDGTGWSGAAAGAAAALTDELTSAAHTVAERIGALSETTAAAADAVSHARARLDDIISTFEARAATLEPHLDEPGVAEQLAAEARQALADAESVIESLRAELDSHAATFSTTAPSTGPIPNTPGMPMFSHGQSLGAGAGPALGAGLGSALAGAAPASRMRSSPAETDPRAFGAGVAVRLPDGSTATAPNAVAASAVRHALTQLGVPYDWGGTTPGVGLDCSGLTQWAYHEAGLDIPRLAQEQDIGAAVDAGSLRPGDLAIWDGHVAMIVGNGTMIEAGDPVQLSPIRTTNAGQGFQGFWRPTA